MEGEATRLLRFGLTITAFGFVIMGCGGSSSFPNPTSSAPVPTASPTPSPAPSASPAAEASRIEVVDGVSGAATGSGQFGVGAGPLQSFTSAFDATPMGADLTVIVPGYLRRTTSLPSSGRVNLWPAANATEEEYVRRIVFINAVDNATERGLFRLPFGTFRVSLASEVDTLESRAALGRVFARLNDATRGAITLSLTVGTQLATLSVDPSITPFGGFTNWNSTGGYITTGTVRLVSASRATSESLLLHEFGHLIGLQHSDRSEDVMNSAARTLEFTTRERSVVAMMFQRSAGMRFPDSDLGTTLRSATDSRAYSCGR